MSLTKRRDPPTMPPREERKVLGFPLDFWLILLVGWFAPLIYAISSIIWPIAPAPLPSVALSYVIGASIAASITFFAIYHSNRTFTHFGIAPWQSSDWGPAVVALSIGLASSLGLQKLVDLTPSLPWTFGVPDTIAPFEVTFTAVFLTVALDLANALQEELIMRGYLLARLYERTQNKFSAVLLTTALFSSYHVYQGPHGILNTLIFGLIYGTIAIHTRRIFPLILAHAAHNIILILYLR